MTYSSRTFLISCGFGSLSRVRSARSSNSSRMMSLHNSTHSSQTNTDGPAISLRTSCWLFPQKEQYNSLPSSCLPRESSLMLSSWTDYIAPLRPDAKLPVLPPAPQRPLSAAPQGYLWSNLTAHSSLCRYLAAFLKHGID